MEKETFPIDDNKDDDLLQPEERKKITKARLFDYCKKGDLRNLMKVIDDENLNIEEEDEKKWTGLTWAVVNGHAEIVKALLQKLEMMNKMSNNGSLNSSLIEQITHDIKTNNLEFNDIFVKPKDPSNYGKYTPLHWAAYKGHVPIASILIKSGYNPLDIDNVGNTSLHQAAASNNYDLFKLFMGLGIDLEIKNARNHMATDLTTNKDIKALITKSLSTKVCEICKRQFDFHTKRYQCRINDETICKNCCMHDYYYENMDSKDKDIFNCRCKNCFTTIQDAENNLRNALRSNNLSDITEAFNMIQINKIQICPKLAKETEFETERLDREKTIYNHLVNLKIVDNHKTIEKSVFMLEQMLAQAKERNIELDTDVVEKAFMEKNRLLAEKELRKVLSNLTVEQSSGDNLDNLFAKLKGAKDSGVEEKYIQVGEELLKKIQLNLSAKELFDLFAAYPIREYPKPEEIDPKKKKKVEKEKPKKRKKKEPPFVIPEWAKELKSLVEKVQEMKNYLNMSSDVGLDNIFIIKTKEQLSRLGDQEIKFRRNEEEMLKKLEEDKKKKKKK